MAAFKNIVCMTVAVVSASCGAAAQSPVEGAENPALARCSADYVHANFTPSAEVRAKLAGELVMRLQEWLGDVGFAHCTNNEAKKAELQTRRISIIVKHGGEIEALTAAGMDTGFDQGGEVGGVIELRRVLDLAALPEVVFMDAEPSVRPN